jgi:hypothetical protein
VVLQFYHSVFFLVLLKLRASSFQVGDSAFMLGFGFPVRTPNWSLSTLGLEVSPISPMGLHPCVLVIFVLFQQRALVSRGVISVMDGFDNGQEKSDSVILFWITRTPVVSAFWRVHTLFAHSPDLCA